MESSAAEFGTDEARADAVTLEITLRNGDPDELLELIWFRAEGVERFTRVYALLRPGDTHLQPTFAGDSWLLRSRTTREVLRRIDARPGGPATQKHFIDLAPNSPAPMQQPLDAASRAGIVSATRRFANFV